MSAAGGPLGPARPEGGPGRQDEPGLPRLPGFREMALRRMAGERRRLVGELTAQRQAAGLSQTQVAARMGTSQSAVARLEAGRGGRAGLHPGALRRGDRQRDQLAVAGPPARGAPAGGLAGPRAGPARSCPGRLPRRGLSAHPGCGPRPGRSRPPRSTGRMDSDRRTPMTVPAADSFPPGRPWPGPPGPGEPGPGGPPSRPAGPEHPAARAFRAGPERPAGPPRTGSRPATRTCRPPGSGPTRVTGLAGSTSGCWSSASSWRQARSTGRPRAC